MLSQELKHTVFLHMKDKRNFMEYDAFCLVSEALEMICVKMARIMNGDPLYRDNWVDIAGYAKLVSDRLEGKER
jgi:hypothetical protein